LKQVSCIGDICTIDTEYLKGRNPEILLQILKEKGIDLVIDIRDSPAYPIYYRPASFKALCATEGIEYQYIKKLGNPKSNRTKYANNPEKQRAEYLRMLQDEPERSEALQQLREQLEAKSEGVCLVCMCDAQDEMGCHRFWLKKLIESS